MNNKSLEICESLLTNAKAGDFAGYDPFDGLNSKFFKSLPTYKSRFIRLAWIQFHKRFPLNLRPILGIPKKRNPKGVALFILGLIEDFRRTKEQSYLDEAKKLGDWLLNERCDRQVWKHSCWAYHFDWESKAFFVPMTKPNIITTIYVSRALHELGEVLKDNKYCEVALDSANFIMDNLRINVDGRDVFGYIPGEIVLVHNANLWGAAWVSFAGKRLDNQEMLEYAKKAADVSAFAQQGNGSWVYGTRSHHQFIDGFHTAYNLEALDIVSREQSSSDYDEIITNGLKYYKEQFFEEDGTCKYYNNNPYPYDMHSAAQAILTFIKLSTRNDNSNIDNQALIEKIIKWSLKEMYIDDKKRFRYQKTRFYSNNNDYIRWTQAWCYYGFSFYNNRCSSSSN